MSELRTQLADMPSGARADRARLIVESSESLRTTAKDEKEATLAAVDREGNTFGEYHVRQADEGWVPDGFSVQLPKEICEALEQG